MLSQQQATIEDQPYTTADEDPFSVQPFQFPPNKTVKHRRSSMLDKWILEQQSQTEETPEDPLPEPLPPPSTRLFTNSRSVAASSSPYLLAYPDLPRFSFEDARAKDDDAASIISYDLVDDDDIPEETKSQEPLQEVPVTPIPRRTHKNSRHSISPSFRSINLTFNRSSSPGATGASSPGMEAASRAFARLSFFPRTPRSSVGPSSTGTISSQHIRTSSLSTLETTASQPSSQLPQSFTSTKSRPSVLGHFSQSSISQVSIGGSEAQYAASRPSISSGDTYTTWNTSRTTTTLESAIPTSSSKFSLLDSIRARSKKSPRTLSSISVASTSSVGLSVSQTDEGTPKSSTRSTENSKGTITQRIPFAPKSGSSLALNNKDNEDDLDPPTYRFTKQPALPYPSSRSLPRVKFASLNSRASKKKKLVISGIGASEFRKLEGVRRWCESFGEVRNIARMPNGDLQIDFRDSDVADTVCRVRAKVFISGVGSVYMSWVSGNKR